MEWLWSSAGGAPPLCQGPSQQLGAIDGGGKAGIKEGAVCGAEELRHQQPTGCPSPPMGWLLRAVRGAPPLSQNASQSQGSAIDGGGEVVVEEGAVCGAEKPRRRRRGGHEGPQLSGQLVWATGRRQSKCGLVGGGAAASAMRAVSLHPRPRHVRGATYPAPTATGSPSWFACRSFRGRLRHRTWPAPTGWGASPHGHDSNRRQGFPSRWVSADGALSSSARYQDVLDTARIQVDLSDGRVDHKREDRQPPPSRSPGRENGPPQHPPRRP